MAGAHREDRNRPQGALIRLWSGSSFPRIPDGGSARGRYPQPVLRVAWPGPDAAALLDRATGLTPRPGARRALLGVAGAPGVGKSTLTAQLLDALDELLPGQVALVGMDAFHLAHAVLRRRGQVAIKGAPETFDVAGYLAMLRRLRAEPEVFTPAFDRSIEDSIAQSVEVGPAVRLVVTEGNYLLLDRGLWRDVRPLLDDAWFLTSDHEARVDRLVVRRESFGEAHDHAVRWATGSDEANAQLVERYRLPADVLVDVR